MFKCKKGETVGPYQKQVKVSTTIREVKYILKAKIPSNNGPDNIKILKTTQGTEIVHEEVYCQLHAPTDIKPEIAGKITREYIILVKRESQKREKRKN